jgi:hypothetical protein
VARLRSCLPRRHDVAEDTARRSILHEATREPHQTHQKCAGKAEERQVVFWVVLKNNRYTHVIGNAHSSRKGNRFCVGLRIGFCGEIRAYAWATGMKKA